MISRKKRNKQKIKGGLGRLVMRAVMAIFLICSVVMLVDMQVSLAQQKQRKEELGRQMESLQLDQKELQRQYAEGIDGDEIERIAREKLDYVRENEKVFVNNSGK